MSDNFETLAPLYGLDKNGGYKYWEVSTCGALIKVTHGKLGGKLTSKLTECVGKNIGKSNETTPSEQARLEAAAKWVKQCDKGYRETKEAAASFKESDPTPMRAHNYNKYANKINYPAWMSPKLNGRRLERKSGKFYAKSGLEDSVLDEELLKQIESLPESCVDGEVYCHGMPLQFINSAWIKPNENTEQLEYWIYDIPDTNQDWVQRQGRLIQLLKYVEDNKSKFKRINVLICDYVSNQDSGDYLYEQYLSNGYEGAVYRNNNGIYEHATKSYGLIKRKPRQSAEAKVLSVIEDKNGNGLMTVCAVLEGSPVFKCLLKTDVDYTDPRNGKVYKLKQQRDYQTITNLVGQWITFEYEELSVKGVPTKPVAIMPRKCNENGEPLE